MNMTMLILSLPTRHSTVRMRAWRALKACGAAVLRDGVYLMPGGKEHRKALEAIAEEVREGDGSAHLLNVEGAEAREYEVLFDRSEAYAELMAQVAAERARLSVQSVGDVLKQVRKLRKAFGQVTKIDFFPGAAQRQVDSALQELEVAIARTQDPDEPRSVAGAIEPLTMEQYQGRLWATRRRPRVDRLASAWLIKTFIDKKARFLWLESPADCPAEALGFDFDNASFTHVGDDVTFEVLLVSFGLDQPALRRLGALVHYLDVGGIQPPEAAGVETVLNGLRETIPDDDQLLACASAVFDGLLNAFNNEASRS